MLESKIDIDILVKKIASGNIPKLNHDELLGLRNAFYDFVLNKNDLPPKEYLWLIKVFEGSNLEDKKEFKNYIKTADNYLDSCDDINQKLLLIHLKTTCLILNSKTKEAMEYYILSFALLNCSEIPNLANYLEFFEKYCKDISFELYYNVCKKLFDPDYYLNLDNAQQRNILNNNLIIFWKFTNVFVNRQIIKIYDLMLKIFNYFVQNDKYEKAMHITLSMIHFYSNTNQGGGNIQNDIIVPLEAMYQRFLNHVNIPTYHTKRHTKKRIGFLKDRIVANSPYKVEYSLIKALMQNEDFRKKYQIYIYSFSTTEKALDDDYTVQELLNLGVKVEAPSFEQFRTQGFYYSYLEKSLLIRDKIIRDEIDILIDFTGSNPLAEFLFVTRSAKKQIYWSHGNTEYNIKSIDLKVSHFQPTSEYKIISVPMDNKFYNPPIDQQLIINERSKYPKDAFILGVISRLVKIDDDRYLRSISEILKQNPKAIYLACGDGGNINRIKAKLDEFGVLDRFYFTGMINPHIYGYIIDLWLNTFPPHVQGESANEYMSKGGAILGYYEPQIFDIDDENIKKIKYDSSKLLVYIENIENFNKQTKGYDEFISDPYYIILNDKPITDSVLKAKSIIGDKSVYDVRVRIEDGKIIGYDGKFFIYKSFFKENAWYERDYEICTWILQNKDICLINENDHIYGYFTAFNMDEYIKKATMLIKNHKIRAQLKKFNSAYLNACKEITSKNILKDFENIICKK
ncbi:glycosyltransferase family 1 protein [Campylobacter fetus]|uniref:hypothetical protein n=1 Tax=Campylobacter fetus TaxID=196 RepID=UPI0008189144|nr:hypothetical protein [Campylobacter fetus]MPB72187.1 glycosyltransferase family 1 protein [Campylobacter fetus]MPB78037.1 glycosyltransferase family 1 protein [Campylobacter fetus]